ncbi:MAG: hypothetical protein HQ521_19625, partial [Bacteroidetes bacterium]|nr:hypothetical protein [Bacteroidota bacterium]
MSGNSKVTLIFPIAGKEAHAGYKYKPFLKIGDEALIEIAIKPFQKWNKDIKTIVFVVLEEHDKKYNVS